jgi:zinc protease
MPGRAAAAGLLFLVLGLLLLAPAYAQTAAPAAQPKDPGPPPAPAKEVRFPSFEQKTLANGLRLVVITQHEQPLVSLRLLLPGGKAFEPAGKAGLADATASLLTKGTASRSAQQIAETIDFVGGNLSAGAGTEVGFASAAVTTDQLGLGFELLADVVLRPSFPQEELDRWRRQALSDLQIQQKSAGYLARNTWLRATFGDHPYGRPGDGTPESLQGLTRDDLAAFHKRYYVAGEAILAVVGDVKPADAFARAEAAFGGWEKGQPAEIPKVEASSRKGHRIIVIDKPDAVQTEIRLGQVGIAFRDPDLYAAEVYNSVTGAGPNSRLADEVRNKRGLSYGAGSFFMEATQPGFFQASTSTKTETTVEALEVSLEVLRGLQKDPVRETELEAAKSFITGAFPLEIETAGGIASKVVEAMRFGLGREFLESYNDRISKVTAADIQRFAKERIHPDSMVIVLAGNAAGFAAKLQEKLGAFETIPAAELDFLRADLRKPKGEPSPTAPGS